MLAVLEFLDKYGPPAGNIVALLVLGYMFADLVRNWNGSSELRIIREQLQSLNDTLRQLIATLSEER